MRRILVVSLAILMIASSAMAVDHIGIFTDQVGMADPCGFTPPGFVPITVYVVHHTDGTTGSQFKVVNNSGWYFSATVLGGFLSIGDAFVDLSLAYGGCLGGPAVAVVALNGFAFPYPGTPCGTMEVVAAPNKPYAITVDCSFAELATTTGKITFNGTVEECCVVAAEQSTWGKVKALYR